MEAGKPCKLPFLGRRTRKLGDKCIQRPESQEVWCVSAEKDDVPTQKGSKSTLPCLVLCGLSAGQWCLCGQRWIFLLRHQLSVYLFQIHPQGISYNLFYDVFIIYQCAFNFHTLVSSPSFFMGFYFDSILWDYVLYYFNHFIFIWSLFCGQPFVLN
jgi:hypothetical protein